MHNPFKKITLPRSSRPHTQKEPQQSPKPSAQPLQENASEDELFTLAMRGVAPLHTKGRDITPPPPPKPGQTKPSANNAAHGLMAKKITFCLEGGHEYLQGHINGLSPKTLNKLKTGAFNIDARLDLHGHTLDQARMALLDFMRMCCCAGKRCVLLIPGKGNNSPLGRGVIRQEVQTWLTKEPFKYVVLAFCTALPKDGGAGALYVLVRKNKKSQDNKMWETIFCNKCW